LEADGLLEAARRMAVAARTAPKAKGRDYIVTLLLLDSDMEPLIKEMEAWGNAKGSATFLRDAATLQKVAAVLLIGTKLARMDLAGCGFCGFPDCAANEKAGATCAFNAGDLGIAIGSAAATAADMRVDTRVLFSAGRAALNLKLLGNDVKLAYGFPISATGKNPWFDRQK